MPATAFLRRTWFAMRGWTNFAVPTMTLGECPRWSADGRTLWWVDIPEGTICRYDSVTGQTRTRRLGKEASALALDADGLPWLVVDGELRTLNESLGDSLVRGQASLPVRVTDEKQCRANDAAFSPDGDLWITTMDRSGRLPTGGIIGFSPAADFRSIADGLRIGNGPVFDATRKVAYVADSPERTVYRISLRSDPSLEPFIRFDDDAGYPDGMAIDGSGRLWIAHYGGGRLSVWSTAGELVRFINTPCVCPTAVAIHETHRGRMIAVTSARQSGEPVTMWLKHYGMGTP